MSRKQMLTVWIGALAVSVLFLGCPKKKPTPPPPAPVEQPAPPKEVAPPPAPEIQDEQEPMFPDDIIELNRVLRERGLIGDVYFDFDKYDLKPAARDRLAKNADFMRQNPGWTYDIEGHCDERGTNEYNLALGDRRANAALNYLGSLGVGGGKVRTISYGEEKPQCRDSNESCWSQNRRAHFVVTSKG